MRGGDDESPTATADALPFSADDIIAEMRKGGNYTQAVERLRKGGMVRRDAH